MGHVAQVAFFAAFAGFWAGLGVRDGDWFPWLMVAIHGVAWLAAFEAATRR